MSMARSPCRKYGLSSNTAARITPGGLTTSCRDLARFGHLWLHRGRWGTGAGEVAALFTPEFVRATSKAPSQTAPDTILQTTLLQDLGSLLLHRH